MEINWHGQQTLNCQHRHWIFSIHHFVQIILRTHPVSEYSFILDTFNNDFQMLRLHGVE